MGLFVSESSSLCSFQLSNFVLFKYSLLSPFHSIICTQHLCIKHLQARSSFSSNIIDSRYLHSPEKVFSTPRLFQAKPVIKTSQKTPLKYYFSAYKAFLCEVEGPAINKKRAVRIFTALESVSLQLNSFGDASLNLKFEAIL